jgi:hypothetical protein
MPLAGDAKGAIAFLRALYPEGPWIVTAIHPDQPEDSPQKINNQVFGPGTHGDFAAWLDRLNPAGYNIYYGVNPLRAGRARANKVDVTHVRYLHVDLDPRAYVVGEDGPDTVEARAAYLDSEIRRIIAKLESPPNGIPRPHNVVLSGGGCNASWRLEEPIRLDHTPEKAEEAERYNIALSLGFGGDHCHDVSRILRMPHTVNWPNETKRRRGRAPTLSSVLWAEAGSYPLTMFRQVEPRQVNGVGSGRGRPMTMIPGSIEPVTSIEQLRSYAKEKERFNEKLVGAIEKGVAADPEKWNGDNSKVLLYVTCEMLRAGVPEAQIYAAITQPAFGCSHHVLKHRSGARRVALRTIDRAKDRVNGGNGPEGDALLDLNDQFFIVGDYGGKCVVFHETKDPFDNRPMLRTQTKDHFVDRFAHRYVTIPAQEGARKGPTRIPLGKWWWEHPRGRRVDRVAFAPGRELPSNIYNLWQGFAVDPTPGDAHQPFLDHVRDIICDGNEENYLYLIHWLADMVQNPGRPGQTAVILHGGQGSGKSTFAELFGRLWGRHYMEVTNTKHLVGHFNHHLADLVFLCATEAFFAGDKENANLLKSLITDSRMVTERKGFDAEQGRNFLHLLMLSNKDWVVSADHDDRRYWVLEVPANPQPADYFTRLRHSMELVEEGGLGGLGHLLYFLQTMDLSNFSPYKRPATRALAKQKVLSLPVEEGWWYLKLEEGQMPRGRAWGDLIPVDELRNDYLSYAQKVQRRGADGVAFGRALHKLVPGLTKTRATVASFNEATRENESHAKQCYRFPPLDACRAAWDKRMGTPEDWGDGPEPPAF